MRGHTSDDLMHLIQIIIYTVPDLPEKPMTTTYIQKK